MHAASWKERFAAYLRARAERMREGFAPFDPVGDSDRYVDGKPRADGTRSLLQSCGITLSEGNADDTPTMETVHGVGNRKNDLVLRRLSDHGVEPYPGSVRYLEAARNAGLRRAVVSPSANAHAVLAAAHIAEFFGICVDGIVAERGGLKGKPAPDTFVAARARDRPSLRGENRCADRQWTDPPATGRVDGNAASERHAEHRVHRF